MNSNIIVGANGAETTTLTTSITSSDTAMIAIRDHEVHIQAPTDGFTPAQAGTCARIIKDQVNAAILAAQGKRIRVPGKDGNVTVCKKENVYSIYLPETKADEDVDATAIRTMDDFAQWMISKAAPGPAPQGNNGNGQTRQQPQNNGQRPAQPAQQTPAATQPTRQQPQQTPQNRHAQQTPPAQPQNNGQQPAQPQPQPQQPQQQTPATQPTRQQPQPPALEPVPWDDPNWNADNWVAQQLGF